jgi:D-arabinose 1-dehydrogenase-like Zn-dependent alcohol dehydrogenase
VESVPVILRPGGARRFWKNFVIPPFIPGHEFVSHIAELGQGITDFAIGDRVVSE